MKRALVVALSAALFTTILGGLASADTANTVHTQADVVVDQPGDDEVRTLFQRCRRLLGEDQLSDTAYEKCVELWKRWCKAHPHARKCPRPKPPPHPCKVSDRVIDVRCHPCKVTDRATDQRVADYRRPCPEPPPPCKATDAVTDLRCCLATDVVNDLRCCQVTDVRRPCPPPPPPPCQITDAVTDLRCCLATDVVNDLRCCLTTDVLRPCPPPPPPCQITDAVSDIRCDPCLRTDAILPCPVPPPVPIPLPIPCDRVAVDGADRVCVPDPCLATDAATSRLCIPTDCKRVDGLIKCEPIPPSDLPADKPVDRPTDKPADTRPQDRPVDRLTDQEGNDVHLRTVDADS